MYYCFIIVIYVIVIFVIIIIILSFNVIDVIIIINMVITFIYYPMHGNIVTLSIIEYVNCLCISSEDSEH